MKQSLNEGNLSLEFARDGEEALKKMKERKPDILILDLMMPKKDGFTVLEEMQQNKSLIDIPVIVVTSKDLINQEKELLLTRSDSVIQNIPFIIQYGVS